jgi:hypothetical protein
MAIAAMTTREQDSVEKRLETMIGGKGQDKSLMALVLYVRFHYYDVMVLQESRSKYFGDGGR